MASEELAELLRGQDAYVAASLDDPCSNALLEALACGLPALYRRAAAIRSSSGTAGVGFDGAEDAPPLSTGSQPTWRASSRDLVPALPDVADRYLEVLDG